MRQRWKGQKKEVHGNFHVLRLIYVHLRLYVEVCVCAANLVRSASVKSVFPLCNVCVCLLPCYQYARLDYYLFILSLSGELRSGKQIV